MLRPRVIPVLLLKGRGLYKTVQFKNPKYVGDPINTVKIFNEKEVDEICILDISATLEGRVPNLELIKEIASESFMPLSYGGGIRSLEQARAIFNCGVEKIVLNSLAFESPDIVRDIVKYAGSSSVVVSVDVGKKFMRGHQVFTRSGSVATKKTPLEFAREMELLGVGEILLYSIERDGMMQGYDYDLIQEISSAVSVPVVACGGAGSLEHLALALSAGASAVAAGSFFVFQGKHRAVLISYPMPREIDSLLLETSRT